MHGHYDVVSKMLAYGADVNERGMDGMTPLLYAVEYNDAKMVVQLVRLGANVKAIDTRCSQNALHYVAQSNNYGCQMEWAEWLLLHGADATQEDDFGNVPFKLADGAVRGLLENAYNSVDEAMRRGI